MEEKFKTASGRNRDVLLIEPSSTEQQRYKTDFDWNREAHNLQRFTTAEGITVFVYEANIVKLPVDCIVNAANGNLQHGGGVAYVIAQAAGHELTSEGDDYIRQHGKIAVGMAITTKAGQLPYNCVIHTVGPRWSDYKPHTLNKVLQCETDLYSAIYQSLKQAEIGNLRTIAVPAVSSAIFGVPEEICVYQYAKATIDFSKDSSRNPSPLKEIHFIDIKSSIIRKIQDMFGVMVRDRRKPDYDVQRYAKPSYQTRQSSFSDYEYNNKNNTSGSKQDRKTQSHATAKFYLEPGNGGCATSLSTPVPLLYEEKGRHVLLMLGRSEEQKMTLYKGDIFDTHADAIVSVEDETGAGNGRIASAISNRTKDYSNQYATEKRQKFNKRLEIGNVVVTNGWASGYRSILHAVLPYEVSMKPDRERKALISKTYANILNKTLTEDGLKSIVLSLIGAGIGSEHGVEISAEAFLDSYITFCNLKVQQQKTKPLTVNLVCHRDSRQTDQLSIVHRILQKYVDNNTPKHPPHRPPSPDLTQNRISSPSLKQSQSEQKYGKDSEKGNCVICMEAITDPKTLVCGHVFCKECIEAQFGYKKACPTCGAVCGIITDTESDEKNGVEDIDQDTEKDSDKDDWYSVDPPVFSMLPSESQSEKEATPSVPTEGPRDDTITVKKMGPHWVLSVNGNKVQMPVLKGAKEVTVEDGCIVAEEEVYEIKKENYGDIFLEKIGIHPVTVSGNIAQNLKTSGSGKDVKDRLVPNFETSSIKTDFKDVMTDDNTEPLKKFGKATGDRESLTMDKTKKGVSTLQSLQSDMRQQNSSCTDRAIKVIKYQNGSGAVRGSPLSPLRTTMNKSQRSRNDNSVTLKSETGSQHPTILPKIKPETDKIREPEKGMTSNPPPRASRQGSKTETKNLVASVTGNDNTTPLDKQGYLATFNMSKMTLTSDNGTTIGPEPFSGNAGQVPGRLMAESECPELIHVESASDETQADDRSSQGQVPGRLMAESECPEAIQVERQADDQSFQGQMTEDLSAQHECPDTIRSIHVESTSAEADTDESSSDEDDLLMDNFDIILRFKDKHGGSSFKILRAENGQEALKWRYIFQNQDSANSFAQKLLPLAATMDYKGGSQAFVDTDKVVKPKSFLRNIKQLIAIETATLSIQETLVDAGEVEKIIEVMSFTCSLFETEDVLRFMQHPSGQTKLWFVGLQDNVTEVMELFKHTQGYLSKITVGNAKKKKTQK